jgi:glutathione peroxidase
VSIHELTAKTIDGEAKKLEAYAGEVLLVVNVASLCGYTPQYKGLEALHRAYKSQGFRVLAFPSNDFGAQEPGSEAEIKTFCTARYEVTFDLFAKVKAKGEGVHPVFAALTAAGTGAASGDVRWNFTKFLVDKKGEFLARFEPNIDPMSAEIRIAVEKALAGA